MMYLIGSRIQYRTDDGAMWPVDDENTVFTLTPTMSRLLTFLIERKGQVIPRDEILHHVWDAAGLNASNHTLNKYISELRKKFVNFGIEDECIITVPRIGFMFSESIEIHILKPKKPEDISPRAQQEVLLPVKKTAWRYYLIASLIFFFAAAILGTLSVRQTPSMLSQKETPLYFLFNYESCPVYTTENNSEALRPLKIEIFSETVKKEGIACLPGASFIHQASESFIYGQAGQVFVSRCTTGAKGYISCLNYYWGGYERAE